MKKTTNNCNLTTCRHNKDGKCTSERDRAICVDVSRKVLCMGGKEDNDNSRYNK